MTPTEDLPLWLSIPLIVILWGTVIYKFYIKKGYDNDRNK